MVSSYRGAICNNHYYKFTVGKYGSSATEIQVVYILSSATAHFKWYSDDIDTCYFNNNPIHFSLHDLSKKPYAEVEEMLNCLSLFS